MITGEVSQCRPKHTQLLIYAHLLERLCYVLQAQLQQRPAINLLEVLSETRPQRQMPEITREMGVRLQPRRCPDPLQLQLLLQAMVPRNELRIRPTWQQR